MRPVVISTFGSLGDVFPYIAVAKELKQQGADVSIATTLDHCAAIERHGIKFIRIGGNLSELFISKDLDATKIMHRFQGPEYVLRKVVMPMVEESYRELDAAISEPSLFITHPLSFAAMLLARKRQDPFISTVLAPLSMWSKTDPPALPFAAWVPDFHKIFGSTATGWLMNFLKSPTYGWLESYRQLQQRVGVEVDRRNALFEGQFSPLKHLALFAPLFGPPQEDWAPNSVVTGFPFLDEEMIDEPTRQKVRNFLHEGTPPVVLTLGSSAVWDSGNFWIHGIEALKMTKLRGVLLTGPSPDKKVPEELGPDIIAVEYLPHSLIFRHALLIVHQGGVGTTAQALRSGRPQLVMPFSHDQFDNARRVARLGCGLIADRNKFSPNSAANSFRQLVSEATMTNAARVGEQIQKERGAAFAAEEIMRTLKEIK